MLQFVDGNWIDQARDQHRCVMEEAEFAWTYDETVAALDTIVITTGEFFLLDFISFSRTPAHSDCTLSTNGYMDIE